MPPLTPKLKVPEPPLLEGNDVAVQDINGMPDVWPQECDTRVKY